MHFCAISHRVRDINISSVRSPKNRIRSRSTISHWQNSMANVRIYKWLPQIFALAPRLKDIKMLILMPFDGKCQKYKKGIFTCLIFAKVWDVLTIFTYWQADRQTVTQTHRHTEMENPMATGKILPKNWNYLLTYLERSGSVMQNSRLKSARCGW